MTRERVHLGRQHARRRTLQYLRDGKSRPQFRRPIPDNRRDSNHIHGPSIALRGSFHIDGEHESPQASPETLQGRFWQRSSSLAPRQLGETRFQYRDLDPKRNEIRLLRILPETTSIIKCELVHISLEDPRSYTAISYAWGNTDDTRTIILDGHEFTVTGSLLLALQRLRSRSDPVIVWVDAVCINQGNVDERNLQVQAMTRIYKQACRVVIWLGIEADNSNMAIELLTALYQSRESRTRIRGIINAQRWRAHFQALVALFERDYWTRLWVVQEIVNAKKITVYCGASEVCWNLCIAVSCLLKQYYHDLIHAFLGERSMLSASGRTWQAVLSDGGPGSLRNLRNQEGGSVGLLDVLLYLQDKSCSEPRDRVYGILGMLSPHERSNFPVDYNRSTRVLYIDVVDYLLTTTRRLDVICASCHFPMHQNVERLPSWVPDWSQCRQVSPLGHCFDRFSAAGNTEARCKFSRRRSELEINAIFIDKIVSCGMHLGQPISDGAMLMAFFQWRLKLIAAKGYNQIEHEAFCRTLSCDQTYNGWSPGRWFEWTYHAFGTLLREHYPALQLDKHLASYANNSTPVSEGLSKGLRQQVFSDYFTSAMVGRRFSITSTGLLCLGSGESQCGDIICVPLGCSTPIILRERSQQPPHYTFVSDAYVDGYMYGKAIEDLNNETRKQEEFVLR